MELQEAGKMLEKASYTTSPKLSIAESLMLLETVSKRAGMGALYLRCEHECICVEYAEDLIAEMFDVELELLTQSNWKVEQNAYTFNMEWVNRVE